MPATRLTRLWPSRRPAADPHVPAHAAPCVLQSSVQSLDGRIIPTSFVCPVSMEIMVRLCCSLARSNRRPSGRPPVGRSCVPARHSTAYPAYLYLHLQVDPVILATGHTYDRHSIERWLAQGHKTCPVTGMRLRHLELTPNFALRSAIVDWAQQNSVKLPERPTQQSVQPVFKWEEGRAGNILHVGAAARPQKPRRALARSLAYAVLVAQHLGAPPAAPYRCVARQQPGVAGLAACPALPAPRPPRHRCLCWHMACLQGHTEIIWAIEVLGSRIYTASADKTVRVWDLNTKRCTQVRFGGGPACRCHRLPAGWQPQRHCGPTAPHRNPPQPPVLARCWPGPIHCRVPSPRCPPHPRLALRRCWRATRGRCCHWPPRAAACSRDLTITPSACGAWAAWHGRRR